MKYILVTAAILLLIDLIVRSGITNKEQIRKKIHKTKHSRIMSFLTSKPGSKNCEKQRKLIQKARLNISVEGYQLVTILTFLVVLVISSTVIFTQQKLKSESVLNKKSININIINLEKTIGSDDAFLNSLTSEAHENINYKELIERGDYKELQEKVYYLTLEKGIDKDMTYEYAKKVYDNLMFLYQNRLSYMHLALIVLISLGSMVLPSIFLQIRAKRTENLMEDELNKLEILTLLLLKKEDINMYQVLIKLKSKSDVFRPYLNKCINDFQKDGRKAMEVMQKEAEYKPFTDFINILKQGIDSNKRTTFNVLEMSRRLRNEILTSMTKEKIAKKNRSILLVRFPMVIVGIYILILPWLIVFNENL